MSDLLNTLRARREERTTRDQELRSRLKEFEILLKEAAGGSDVSASSEQRKLQDIGDSDYSYGYLTFDGTSLLIAYRTTEDDLSGGENGFEPTFHPVDLDKCDPVWLRALAVDKVMDSLAMNLIASFEADIAASVRGVRAVEAAANLPLRELEVGIVHVATQLGYSRVLEQWQKAQAALAVDAAEAVTRASQLIETLCKHILQSNNLPLPSGTPDIQDLYKAAAKALSLSPDGKTRSPHPDGLRIRNRGPGGRHFTEPRKHCPWSCSEQHTDDFLAGQARR